MAVRQRELVSPRLVKLLAAIVVGLSIGTLVPPEPVMLPYLGSVSAVLVGGTGLLVGAAVYRWVPALVSTSSSDCGCSGDCGCS